jgi:cytochrome c2
MNLFYKTITFKPGWTLRILTGLISFLIMLSVCAITGILDVSQLGARDQIFKGRSVEAGAKLYAEQCSRCHAFDGKGQDGIAPALNTEYFLGKAEPKILDNNVLELTTVKPSARMKEIGWTGTVLNYIKGVTAAGVPLKSNSDWAEPHPTFAQAYGGNLREDEVNNVADYVYNWVLEPYTGDDAIKAFVPGEGGAPKPTPVPLTAEQEKGKGLITAKGCNACHAIKGVATGLVGPGLNKVYADAQAIIQQADYKSSQGKATTPEDYILESIVAPNAYIYPKCPQGACPAAIMPPNFKDVLTADELNALVAYMITLK